MFNLDDFNEIEKWCKSVCGLIEDNKKIKKILRDEYPFDENLNDTEHKLYDLIISCPNSNYLQYHQDGRLNGVVPYFIKNFNDIKLLIDDLKDLDNNIEDVFNHR